MLIALVLAASIGGNNQQNAAQKTDEHSQNQQRSAQASDTAGVQHRNPSGPTNGKGEDTQSGPWCRVFEFPADAKFIDKVTFFAAACTFIYMVFTILIWNAMRHTLNLARVEMRPWIASGELPLVSEGVIAINPDQKTYFTVEIKNIGKTPAATKHVSVVTFIADEYRDERGETESQPVIAPNDSRFLQARIREMPLDTLNRIGNDLHVFLCGWVEYTDWKGEGDYLTVFAHRLGRVRNPDGSTGWHWMDEGSHSRMV